MTGRRYSTPEKVARLTEAGFKPRRSDGLWQAPADMGKTPKYVTLQTAWRWLLDAEALEQARTSLRRMEANSDLLIGGRRYVRDHQGVPRLEEAS